MVEDRERCLLVESKQAMADGLLSNMEDTLSEDGHSLQQL